MTEFITDEEIKVALASVLDALGLTWDELTEQATAGRFESDMARRAWFSLCGIVNAGTES